MCDLVRERFEVMGTRAVVRIYDEQENLVLTLKSQMEGGGLGIEMHERLGRTKLVNGFRDEENEANGMGCFAAQLVASLKTEVGRFYIEAPNPDTVWPPWVAYLYDFRPKNGCLMLKVMERPFIVLYDGPFKDYEGHK